MNKRLVRAIVDALSNIENKKLFTARELSSICKDYSTRKIANCLRVLALFKYLERIKTGDGYFFYKKIKDIPKKEVDNIMKKIETVRYI